MIRSLFVNLPVSDLGPVNAIGVHCAARLAPRGQEEGGSGCRSTTER